MDPRIAKLIHKGVAPEAAQALVAAGIDTPRKIKAAKVAELKDVDAYTDNRVKVWRSNK